MLLLKEGIHSTLQVLFQIRDYNVAYKYILHVYVMFLFGICYVSYSIFPFRVTANLSTFVVDFKSHSKNINS